MKVSGFMKRYVPSRKTGEVRKGNTYRSARRNMAISFYREAKMQGAHKQ